jgi:outer membrane protein
MHLYGNRVVIDENCPQTGPMGQSEQTQIASLVRNRKGDRKQSAGRLRAAAVVLLGLTTAMPPGFAQQAAPQPGDKVLQDLPAAPVPTPTDPLYLRPSTRDFTKPYAGLRGNPLNVYKPTKIGKASFANSVRLGDLVKDGKIYLSLSDAIALALENNFDIAIARYDLDIADTDILRARSGNLLLGAPSAVITGTIGGSSSTLTTGGGPGGSSIGSGGAGSGTNGLLLTAAGAGPIPEAFDPTLTGALQFDHASSPMTNFFTGGTAQTNTYDFTYNQGFATGTAVQVGFNNTYATNTNAVASFSPQLNASFKATVTQHLLQGAGIWVNKRFIYQAINDRRITDSSFRQQLLYTVNQVENIYWSLVSSYEDLLAKERALEQTSKVASDNRKQLEIGTMAPLDVVTADSSVAADKQALIASQSNLNYQQLIIKQAIARNLNDPALVAAAIIPTDRVSLDELPEEKQPTEDLVQEAFKQRPELEQALLALKNDEITVRGARNALLPTIDIFAYLGGQGLAGTPNPNCPTEFCPPPLPAPTGYGTALDNTFNNSSPDKGVGFNVTIPIRNRLAQSQQARSLVEYRQAQLRLEQLYTQIRMQIINAQFALTNDRAAVLAADAAQKFNAQSLDAEQKKLHLGASTTALVLQQSRNLATAENSLTSARAAYAQARASLYQLLATTLQHYGINLDDSAAGVVKQAPIVPGLEPAKDTRQPTVPTPEQQKQQEQSVPTAPTVPPAPSTAPPSQQ